jgi:hypothetical protein
MRKSKFIKILMYDHFEKVLAFMNLKAFGNPLDMANRSGGAKLIADFRLRIAD